ncbi:MAG: hypothetical protein LBU89_04425 [Fibromonadaceae bacterium]|jgi:hypothetical protein|nr:hypothetical protein [Fibromonadaceae bacterium]
MLKRLTLLLFALALMSLAACASKGSRASYDDDDGGGGGGGGRSAPVRADDLNQAQREATSLTEENHKMAREIFELKNRLGLPTDE